MKFSITQVSNYTSLIVVLVQLLRINISSEEIQGGVGALILIVSLVINIINRAKQGDLMLGVVKKV